MVRMAALQPRPQSRGETWAGALCLGFSISKEVMITSYFLGQRCSAWDGAHGGSRVWGGIDFFCARCCAGRVILTPPRGLAVALTQVEGSAETHKLGSGACWRARARKLGGKLR